MESDRREYNGAAGSYSGTVWGLKSRKVPKRYIKSEKIETEKAL